ncbi:hypothetical protein SMICM304S_12167 [Streptomyces microflavus]
MGAWDIGHFDTTAADFGGKRVDSAGVLYVWFFRELSIAVGSEKNSGMCRPEAWIRAARSRAAGENTPIHRPPSEAKDFCGAK